MNQNYLNQDKSIFAKSEGELALDTAMQKGTRRFGEMLAGEGKRRPVDASFGSQKNPIESSALKNKPTRVSQPKNNPKMPDKESTYFWFT